MVILDFAVRYRLVPKQSASLEAGGLSSCPRPFQTLLHEVLWSVNTQPLFGSRLAGS